MTDFESENAFTADLVRRIADGEREAEVELIKLFDRRLMVKLRNGTRNPDVVLELRQEVWLRTLETLRAGTLKSPRHFHGFLVGMARNVIREHYKSGRREVVDLEAVKVISDTGAAVEERLDQAFLAEKIQECLDSMHERDREILVRHYLREDPKEDTCRILGLTSLNYNNVLYRARKRLSELMDESGAWPGEMRQNQN